MAYPLLTCQQHNTYGIHAWTCGWMVLILRNPNLDMWLKKNMLKGEQAIIGLKNIWKRGYIEQTCECRNKKKKKIGFLGNGIRHAQIGLCTHEFSLHAQARSCVCRSLSWKPNLHKNRVKAKQNIKHKI